MWGSLENRCGYHALLEPKKLINQGASCFVFIVPCWMGAYHFAQVQSSNHARIAPKDKPLWWWASQKSKPKRLSVNLGRSQESRAQGGCGYMWIHVDTCGCMWIHVDTGGYRWIQVDTCGYMWIHVDTLKTLDRGAYITIIQTMLQSRGSSNTIAQPFKSMVPEYQRRTRVLQQEYGPFGQNEEADQD